MEINNSSWGESPSAARIYDWYLGGDSHHVVDREFGEAAVQKFPLVRPLARSNRNWLGRVVRAALDAGITQFLDLGSGIPAVGNVHQLVGEALGPGEGRVVYVDAEPVAVEHARAVLERDSAGSWSGVVHQDLRRPEQVFADPIAQQHLDLSRPVCVLLVSVLHFVGDDAGAVIGGYRERIAPGSWLALSHITSDASTPEQAGQLETLRSAYDHTQNPAWIRDRTEIASWFDGLDLVEPGLVHLTDWRPAPAHQELDLETDVRPFYWCAAGQKR